MHPVFAQCPPELRRAGFALWRTLPPRRSPPGAGWQITRDPVGSIHPQSSAITGADGALCCPLGAVNLAYLIRKRRTQGYEGPPFAAFRDLYPYHPTALRWPAADDDLWDFIFTLGTDRELAEALGLVLEE